MEQNQNSPSPVLNQDEAFKKRRNQKNWIVLSIVFGCVALVWAVTLLKMQHGG